MPKTGVFILTCNILTKKEEYIPFEYFNFKVYRIPESKIIIDLSISDSICECVGNSFVAQSAVNIIKKKRNKYKSEYYKAVWKITLENDLNEVMGGKERGFHKYHIDHITPISYGFKHGISPEQIGHISNLRPLFWRKNLLKAARIKQDFKEQLLLF